MKLAFAVLLTLPLLGCGGGGSSTPLATAGMCDELSSDTFSCATMLQDMSNVAKQTAATVKTDLIQLNTDIGSYCGAQNISTLDTAKAQWITTMASVQQLEVMQFDSIDASREHLYNWPLNDTCKVDLQVATGTTDITTVPNGRRGLNAVEYVLFEEDTLPSCISLSSSVEQWVAANDLAARKQARCEYAKVVVADLVDRAGVLETELATLDLAAKFDSLQLAANSISDALFYVDKQSKDAKIKAALPQASDGEFKATSLESQFAHISKEHLKNNLMGAKAIFTANGQTGFEGYLIAAGQSTLAANMVSSLDAAIANLDVIDEDLYSVVLAASDVSACINTTEYVNADSNIIKFCALQVNIKTFTDFLKEDFVLALKFTKPAAADGDND